MTHKAGVVHPFWLRAVICGTLFALTLAVYLPALHGEFVNYDDGEYVFGNPGIQNGLTWRCVKWAFTTDHAGNWHPLTWISHALDIQFFGLKPAGHHLTSILFHAVNAVLVFWLFLEMTGATWRSAFIAALFAWHPLHVESVAWVSERKDVLSSFFALLTLICHARFKVQGSKFKVWHGVALFCFILGLLSKPMLVTVPFVMLLLDFWPLNQIAGCGLPVAELTGQGAHRIKLPEKGGPRSHCVSSPSPPSGERAGVRGRHDTTKCADALLKLKYLLLEKIPFFLLAIASCVITYFVQQKGGAVSHSITFPARVANAFVSYLRYVGKTFWPENLSVLYPHPGSWPVLLVIAAVLFLIATTVLVVMQWRARPYLLVGWFWFLGMLVPVIGLVQVGVQSMADRYTYLPGVGLSIMLAWGVPDLLARWEKRNFAMAAGSAVAFSACLLVTFRQVGFWHDSGTLFEHVVTVTKDNYLAWNNLGFYFENHGKKDRALECFKKSLAINPNYEVAQNNYGHILATRAHTRQELEEAIIHYKEALRIKPDLAEAHNNLGNAVGDLGRQDEAIAEYETALRCDPENEDAYNNLGIARAMQGRLEEAARLLREAVELKPSDAGAHSNLGNVLAAQKKFDKAVEEYKAALDWNPNEAQARNNLANVLIEQGKLQEAREYYLAALKLNPNNPEAHCNLGILLVRLGQPQEAAAHFTEALRIKPDYAAARQQLDLMKSGPQRQ